MNAGPGYPPHHAIARGPRTYLHPAKVDFLYHAVLKTRLRIIHPHGAASRSFPVAKSHTLSSSAPGQTIQFA
jgi:hypothetical protein